jgi:hypothetical protein
MTNDLTFNDYTNLLNGNIFRQRVKVEMLRFADFSVETEITGDLINDSNSSLTVTRNNGIRRVVQFNMQNPIINNVAKNVPDMKNNFLSPRTPFRLWLGLADDNDNTYFISQGIYLLSTPVVVSNFAEGTLTINGVDPFSLYDGTLGGELSNTYTIAAGINLYVAINDVLTEQNYPLSPILDSQFLTQVLPYTITTTSGNKLGDILVELAGMVSANCYFDINGRFVFAGDTQDEIKASLWDFSTNEFSYEGATNTYNYPNLYNSIVVIGSNINSLNNVTYTATATNTNLASSTSVKNLGYTRTNLITDNLIPNNTQCLWRANYELKRAIAEECDIAILCVPVYHLDVDCVITLTDPLLNYTLERFLINSYTIPFNTGGQMSINAVSAVDIAYTN